MPIGLGRSQLAILVAAALAIANAGSAHAVTARIGDVLAAEYGVLVIQPAPARLALLDATLSTTATFGHGPAAVGASTIYDSGTSRIFDTSLSPIGMLPVFGYMTTDAAENAYVLNWNYLQTVATMYVVDRNGTVLRQFTLPDVAPASHIDLAPDNCTLWYRSRNSHASRYDVCSNRSLPEIAPTQEFGFVRGLTGGGFIGGLGTVIAAYNANGQLIGSIPVPGNDAYNSAVAFAADGQSVYLVGSAQGRTVIEKVRLSDGVVLVSADTGGWFVDSLSVFGEQRPTAEQIGAAGLPIFWPGAIIALAAVLALIALKKIA
jgi:hypothetical protein